MTKHDAERETCVLLVEDNDDSRETLGLLLGMWGHETALADTGARALELAREHAPWVALVDIGLPDVDGYELAHRLQNLEQPPSHLIALSGYGSDEDLERSHEAGFDHHLVKPVDLDRLRNLLAELSD